ncbi:MAG: dephospho-CoA kinase [Pedobacter sp.]|nr:MAG: dephospho-CoA kinase [Pedobacter sp.]
MLKIGITGGIGSGKTTVCKIFETLGIPVFYADNVAKQIMATDELLVSGVKKVFGVESYFGDGSLNNKHIANIVFNNIDQLNKLNALVHPAVFRAFDTWFANLPKGIPYTLKEAALLFESGSYQMSDKNVLVVSPTKLKLERVIKRDSVTEEQVVARMNKQLSDKQKLKMADFIVHNDDEHSLITQVMELHQQFLNLKF